MLYETKGDPAILAVVERLYNDLIESPDYLIYGGVLEFFGGTHDRDEGCSEADFLRLSLQLWQATGNTKYLELAERCMLNIFYAGQFETGDFGHRGSTRRYISRPSSAAPGGAAPCTATAPSPDAGMPVTRDGTTTRINCF